MAQRRGPVGRFSWPLGLSLVLALAPGCGQLRPLRPQEHASAELLDSGPTPKLSSRQVADVQVALGRSLEETGNLTEAETAYRKAIENDSSRADAEERLAVLADQRGDVKESSRHFAKALKLDPKNPEILCDQGYSFYLQRRWADADSSLRKAISLQPKHARSHTNLGLLLARQGDKEGALAEFGRAGCDRSDAQANLGLVLALEGNFLEAKQAYTAALAAKPKSERAEEGLRATTVALAGGRSNTLDDASAIAQSRVSPPRVDPALSRTSAVVAPVTAK